MNSSFDFIKYVVRGYFLTSQVSLKLSVVLIQRIQPSLLAPHH